MMLDVSIQGCTSGCFSRLKYLAAVHTCPRDIQCHGKLITRIDKQTPSTR